MKYKVFISSVQKEFEQERIAIANYIRTDELLCAFFNPYLFEEEAANEHTPNAVYINKVNQSHIYLALLGQQYGCEFADGLSPTEKEYDAATATHIPRWVFLKGSNSLKRDKKEQSFIQKAGNDVARKRFSNLDELKKEVYRSCINFLKRKGKVHNTDFDQSIAVGVSIDAIDADLVKAFVTKARNKRNFPLSETTATNDVLTHLNLLRDGELVNSALLLFSENPQQYFPSASIKCAHFHGEQVQKPIPDFKEYKGTVYNQIEKSIDFVLSKISLSTGTRDHGSDVETNYEIPRAVISEAIINAVAHRDYTSNASVQISVFKNRIEISNPGSLPKELSIASLNKSHKSYPYNLNLADCLFQTGTIERYGTGTLEIYSLSAERGLNAPEYSLDEGVKLTLWRSSEELLKSFGENSEGIRKEFGTISERIRAEFGTSVEATFKVIVENSGYTAKEIADERGVTSRTVEIHQSKLKEGGYIKRVGGNVGGYWKVNANEEK